MAMFSSRSMLALCFLLTTCALFGSSSASYTVVTTIQGDVLETIDQSTGQYGVYDCTADETIVYGLVVTEAPTPVPTLDPTPQPTAQPTDAPTKNPTAWPTAQPTANPTKVPGTQSILSNWDFEAGTIDPWTRNGGDGTIELAYDPELDSNVGRSVGRNPNNRWEGIGQDATGIIQAGEDYNIEIKARLLDVPDSDTDRFSLTLAIYYSDADTQYRGLIWTDQLTNQWQTFQGYFGPFEPIGSVTALRVYAEGPTGHNFAIDDVILLPDLTTSAPTLSPTAAPTQPTGYIDSSQNTERVEIPVPPRPDFSPNNNRVECPHLDVDGSVVDWNTQFGTSLMEKQDIFIPDGATILITETIPTTLGYIHIPPTSTLIIGEDNTFGISIDAQGIDVQGSLIAGSETCRLQAEVSITLHGSLPSSAQSPLYKGISVTGTLSLHGKRFYRTWTRLARRALQGDTVLFLQDEVNWEAGQEVVLVTSALRDSRDWHENEIHIIESVETSNMPSSEVKSIVFLTAPVRYTHIARREYQVEVGLLTRTIKVQGAADDSLPLDTSPNSCQMLDHNGNDRSIFGYDSVDCPNTYLTGYGGHIMMHSGGVGYVEGVELYRMGQTNFLGRYPIHFHVLGDGCTGCFFRDSSVHESFYRCISVHATNALEVSENVAYDITGFCYYLEDGIEERNTFSFNLAAHIHFLSYPASGDSQRINVVEENANLLLPADIAASGFYITNMYNTLVGNTASGGWAGFAFPILDTPLGMHRTLDYSPRKKVSLEINGNTAHSTAHFWGSAAAFYFGGSLYYNGETLTYNAGRNNNFSTESRSPCIEDPETGDCVGTENHITNSKVFLVANVGIGSWTGRMDVVKYEAHDVGLALEALTSGFWIDQMTVACRTSEVLKLPAQRADYVRANGFVWYDTGQDHIITNSTFRSCGFRSEEYNQYNTDPTRGCDSNLERGCHSQSSTFGFLTHSDQFNPEMMQATSGLIFENIGRKFRFSRTDIETVSGRTQNWYDADGSVSGFGVPTLLGSGLPSAGMWWNVDDDVFMDIQAPLALIREDQGPARGLAHIRLEWDNILHETVGISTCPNGRPTTGGLPCDSHGYVRHLGERFSSDLGLPVTAQPEIVGLAGGYGWLLSLDEGAPKELKIMQIEVLPTTPLLFSVQYPLGTQIEVTAKAASWCYSTCDKPCKESFNQVNTVDEVRRSQGNVYHLDASSGLMTIRITMFPDAFTGSPDWKVFDFDDLGHNGEGYALDRYSRKGVLLPRAAYGAHISIVADCAPGGSNNAYCQQLPDYTADMDSGICSSGFEQVSYDQCCEIRNPSNCEYPEMLTAPPTLAPGQTAAPSSPNPEVLDNGDFEAEDLCPWERRGGVTLDLDTIIVSSGSSALRVTGRTAAWQGIQQTNLLGKFQYDQSYDFSGQIYILNSASENVFESRITVFYDTSTENCSRSSQTFYIYNQNGIPGDSWFSMSRDNFSIASRDLESGCEVIAIRFETQSWPQVFDFIIDDLSLYESFA